MSRAALPIPIAFCITDLDPGGAERALVQLVTRLDRTRWEPAVWCLSGPGPLADELRAAGIGVECLGARHWSNLGAVVRLVGRLRRFRPAVVQTFLFHANLAGRVAAAIAGVPAIVSGIRVAEKRSPIPLWLDRYTNALVSTNVCVSQAVADFSIAAGRLASNKIVVIRNGVDVAKFARDRPADLAEFGIPYDSPVFLAVGRLDRQKGLLDLIEAAALVIPRHPRVHFLIVGEGPARPDIELLIHKKGVGAHVHLTGWRPDVAALLATGRALVLASLWEGLPNVVLEAMAAGLAVIATRVEGTSELVIDGQTGVLVPPHSPGNLAAACQQLLSDPDLARAMGDAGRQRAAAEFSWEKMTDQYERLYESLAAAVPM